MRYRGVNIIKTSEGFVWEEPVYGQESEMYFASVDAAKADIELWFNDGPGPVVEYGEIIYPDT